MYPVSAVEDNDIQNKVNQPNTDNLRGIYWYYYIIVCQHTNVVGYFVV